MECAEPEVPARQQRKRRGSAQFCRAYSPGLRALALASVESAEGRSQCKCMLSQRQRETCFRVVPGIGWVARCRCPVSAQPRAGEFVVTTVTNWGEFRARKVCRPVSGPATCPACLWWCPTTCSNPPAACLSSVPLAGVGGGCSEVVECGAGERHGMEHKIYHRGHGMSPMAGCHAHMSDTGVRSSGSCCRHERDMPVQSMRHSMQGRR